MRLKQCVISYFCTIDVTGVLNSSYYVESSAVTHPSSSHARLCLIWLSCDNRCARYTTPLASVGRKPTVNEAIVGDLAHSSLNSDNWQKVVRRELRPAKNKQGLTMYPVNLCVGPETFLIDTGASDSLI
ncbi:hypothetical protein J6590_047981 [Homalodisca vitripennis]|nr:hypothetical protein J6590_047981 [Homalodisca vitripennis]